MASSAGFAFPRFPLQPARARRVPPPSAAVAALRRSIGRITLSTDHNSPRMAIPGSRGVEKPSLFTRDFFRFSTAACRADPSFGTKLLIFQGLDDVPIFHSPKAQDIGFKLQSQTSP
jgi:hypothetical protein